ncbi:MAG: hypothetical protein DWB56_15675 [Candidatus Jettenia sp.]|uniref:Uncharacterized protein n=1 Tax=Candidatus Jettenia caeni TaxID=247490 RepID=I3IKE6_9BACT|nr:hypothetical protein [Candidatus Jettenia sp. AMX1]MBC6930370.1 hypothetical protein [Candidatus Jettenia sp.]NUN23109.1 hypothetical protein [Candidatus Jettenia caeni]KAA0247487.1 MAG: hypothetical protein EDM77_15160 [Candidatus Jettenia sp. AMX1]MCE7881966.1 hypothetical protein [Candidatus Jettenia sp. AMX1]MCQ3928524.1 hypothetical protein [Candidatus Jettenia sp.]
MILSDNEVTTIINQIEKYRLTANSKTRREHIEHVNTIKENKKAKVPDIQLKNHFSSIIKKPKRQHIITHQGNNIGYIPLPGFDAITANLPNNSSNKCSICGTTVTQYMLEYCLNNPQIFKDKIYCNKHLP